MAIEPDSAIWRALLSACRIHGNIELGERIIDYVVEVEPKHGGGLVLLSNIYASNNRWDGVGRVRRVMKQRRVESVPGWSSIEVGGVIHEFLAGDKSHSLTRVICHAG
ncbi:hypothetical protein AMTRI_Chr02g259300 [Amborella trichopoda]